MVHASLPLITIGITCFNAMDTISRAIDSAVQQNWPNKEILIVDDGSSDDSISVVQNLIKDIPAARLVCHESNKGTAEARNTLLAESRGEYIAFFDDDDASLPERLRSQYDRICAYEAQTGVRQLACYMSGYRLYKNGYKVALKVAGLSDPVPQGPDMARYLLYFRKKAHVSYGGTPTCALMGRVSVFREVGGFDPRFRRIQDVDLAVRLALNGAHFIGCTDELLLQYATGGADKKPDILYAAWQTLIEKNRAFLEADGRYDYARRWIKLRHLHFSKQKIKSYAALLDILLRYPVIGFHHIMQTGPRRLMHEFKIRRGRVL